MDQAVLDAIERWPNVPAVYGWLSLSKRGQWRLHPNGTANQGGFGETIHNQQILSFMDRNYACDDQGRWFFQNGPQRVYVRLDAAPFVISITGQPAAFQTHNQRPVQRFEHWVIDRAGQLYLRCEWGAAMISDLDLELVVSALQTETGTDLLDWWSSHHEQINASTCVQFKPASKLSDLPIEPRLMRLELLPTDSTIDQWLGFVTLPQAL